MEGFSWKSNGSAVTKSVHFTVSGPPSRSSSPILNEERHTIHGETDGTTPDTKLRRIYDLNDDDDDMTPGRQAQDVYDTTLSWWRASIRRRLVRSIQMESEVIARMQDKIRTPWLDAYFVYTSSLGTHTFFMILLPAFFFFGYDEMGRGLLMVLALGVYSSSVIKDLICSPRPIAPPVTRLTIGSHHLEYGFPSTHSTNSVSIALFFFAQVHRLASMPIPSPAAILSALTDTSTVESPTAIISPALYYVFSTILLIYTFSIVFGRLYTAMHSFTDCIVGAILGAGIWWGHTSWAGVPISVTTSNPFYSLLNLAGFGSPDTSSLSTLVYVGKGLGLGKAVESWVQRGGYEVPLILIPLCMLAVNQHPQPVDDCPCFEDAIAFASVVLGALVSRWGVSFFYERTLTGTDHSIVLMPGSGWVRDTLASSGWAPTPRTYWDILLWWSVAATKMTLGILIIFAWRILAKSFLHIILPPTFRLLSRVFRLPHRRFYTPATEYKSVPSEFLVHSSDGSSGFGIGLHPIPSVIDLPGSAGVGFEVGGIGSGVDGVSSVHDYLANGGDLKMRSGASVTGNGHVGGNENGGGYLQSLEKSSRAVTDKERTGKDSLAEKVKHYDADVLTKVIVYAGIAVLAAEVIPILFEITGLGVHSSL